MKTFTLLPDGSLAVEISGAPLKTLSGATLLDAKGVAITSGAGFTVPPDQLEAHARDPEFLKDAPAAVVAAVNATIAAVKAERDALLAAAAADAGA